MSDIIQYSQAEGLDTSDSIADSLQARSNDTLSDLQLKNIGIGLLGFSPVSATSGKLNTNEGFDRIAQGIRVILRTVLGEVPMLPILGSNLDKYLFDPLDDVWDDAVTLEIQSALTKLESRIVVMDVQIFHESDENKAIVQITYRLTNTNIVRIFRDTIVTANGGDAL